MPLVRDFALATAFGAACLAGLAVGFWQNTEEIAKMVEQNGYKSFNPVMPLAEVNTLYENWQNAIMRTKSNIAE